jgi:hypothetical protein
MTTNGTVSDEATVDIQVDGEGPMSTLFVFRPLTDAARAWADEHIPDDAQWFGGGFVVEHGYARDIAVAAINDGLVVR